MEQDFNRMLSFLVTSALECANEPSPYGALRLLEAARQMIEFADTYGLLREAALRQIAERIAAEEETALTDRPRFQKLIEEIAMTLVNLT